MKVSKILWNKNEFLRILNLILDLRIRRFSQGVWETKNASNKRYITSFKSDTQAQIPIKNFAEMGVHGLMVCKILESSLLALIKAENS